MGVLLVAGLEMAAPDLDRMVHLWDWCCSWLDGARLLLLALLRECPVCRVKALLFLGGMGAQQHSIHSRQAEAES